MKLIYGKWHTKEIYTFLFVIKNICVNLVTKIMVIPYYKLDSKEINILGR